MTTIAPPPPTAPATQEVTTPTVGRVAKRALFWVGVAVFLLIIAIVALGASGSSTGGTPLDPANPAPPGAMAVAEVLKQQGVDVVATTSLAETKDAITSAADTTLFIFDDGLYLDNDKLRQAVALADTVVIANPDFGSLRAIAPGLAQAGYVDSTLTADCDVAVVQRSQVISGTGTGFRVVDDSAGVTGCFGSGDEVYSLVQVVDGQKTLSVLGATGAISNEFVANDGNAAFALGLLGEHETLVWYLPSFADLDEAGPETLGDLSPAWVIPVMALLVLTFIVGAFWRGRRLGPLVVENLPVVVRASETMRGRARLYEKSSSRLRALDSLRIGTVQRLATLTGLPRTATVDDVVASVASVTGRQPASVRALLVDDIPQTDRDLIASSDALLLLERDVAQAIAP